MLLLQCRNDRPICRRKLELIQLPGKYPFDFTAADGSRLPGFDRAMEEMQLHDLIMIIVSDDLKQSRGSDPYAQFLGKLPLQAGFQRFPRFPLPAGKLP